MVTAPSSLFSGLCLATSIPCLNWPQLPPPLPLMSPYYAVFGALVTISDYPSYSLSRVSRSGMPDSATPWTVAHQALLSMGFSRQGYWSGLPFPSPGNLPNQGSDLCLLHWQVDSFPLSHQGSPCLSISLSSVAQLCLTLCNPMDCSTPGFPVHHQLLELA